MSWNSYNPENSKGPTGFFTKIVMLFVVLSLIGGAATFFLNYVGDAGKVAQEQFSASALLKKYEWFKDAYAQLDAKRKNIQVMEKRLASLVAQYNGDNGKPLARNKWARADAEQFNQWESEIAGLKANYNDLAAQYNSAMSKFNFRFTNVGDLPAGADQPLPRSVVVYVD